MKSLLRNILWQKNMVLYASFSMRKFFSDFINNDSFNRFKTFFVVRFTSNIIMSPAFIVIGINSAAHRMVIICKYYFA